MVTTGTLLDSTTNVSAAEPFRVVCWRRAVQTLVLTGEVRRALEADLRGGLARSRSLGEHEDARMIEARLAEVAHGARARDLAETVCETRLAHADVPGDVAHGE